MLYLEDDDVFRPVSKNKTATMFFLNKTSIYRWSPQSKLALVSR